MTASQWISHMNASFDAGARKLTSDSRAAPRAGWPDLSANGCEFSGDGGFLATSSAPLDDPLLGSPGPGKGTGHRGLATAPKLPPERGERLRPPPRPPHPCLMTVDAKTGSAEPFAESWSRVGASAFGGGDAVGKLFFASGNTDGDVAVYGPRGK
eukprot:gene15964-21814_t